jgi:hypothetical protein
MELKTHRKMFSTRSKSLSDVTSVLKEPHNDAFPFREAESAGVPGFEELPAPTYFKSCANTKPKQESEIPCEKQPTTVLSLVWPFQFVSVSQDMCQMFGYRAQAMTGRSLNMLQGPNTNEIALATAIEKAGMLKSSNVQVILYSKAGLECLVRADCSPFLAEDGTLAGCALQLSMGEAA